jgi:hypothetical protein
MKTLALVISTAVLLLLMANAAVMLVRIPSFEQLLSTSLAVLIVGIPFLAYCMSVVRPTRHWRVAAMISNWLLLAIVVALGVVVAIFRGPDDAKYFAIAGLVTLPLLVNLLALRARRSDAGRHA